MKIIEGIIIAFSFIYGIIDFLAPILILSILSDIQEIQEKIKKR